MKNIVKKEINNIVYLLFLKLHTRDSFLNSNYLSYVGCTAGPFVSIKTKKLISKTFFKFVVSQFFAKNETHLLSCAIQTNKFLIQ